MRISVKLTGFVLAIVLLAGSFYGLRFLGSQTSLFCKELLAENHVAADLNDWQRNSQPLRQSKYVAFEAWLREDATLEETIKRFQVLDEEMSKLRPERTDKTVQLPDKEKHRQYLTLAIRTLFAERPQDLAQATARLDKEFEQLEGHGHGARAGAGTAARTLEIHVGEVHLER